jgi:hypothetical protein
MVGWWVGWLVGWLLLFFTVQEQGLREGKKRIMFCACCWWLIEERSVDDCFLIYIFYGAVRCSTVQ